MFWSLCNVKLAEASLSIDAVIVHGVAIAIGRWYKRMTDREAGGPAEVDGGRCGTRVDLRTRRMSDVREGGRDGADRGGEALPWRSFGSRTAKRWVENGLARPSVGR